MKNRRSKVIHTGATLMRCPFISRRIMRELNEEQRIAVSHFAGPMLVLAGPGSGKDIYNYRAYQTVG